MWPAKFPGEGAAVYDAAKAMADIMIELGIAIDGGTLFGKCFACAHGATQRSDGCVVVMQERTRSQWRLP